MLVDMNVKCGATLGPRGGGQPVVGLGIMRVDLFDVRRDPANARICRSSLLEGAWL